MKKVGNQGFREKGDEGGKHGEVKTKSRPERPQYASPGCEPWVTGLPDYRITGLFNYQIYWFPGFPGSIPYPVISPQ